MSDFHSTKRDRKTSIISEIVLPLCGVQVKLTRFIFLTKSIFVANNPHLQMQFLRAVFHSQRLQ